MSDCDERKAFGKVQSLRKIILALVSKIMYIIIKIIAKIFAW